MLRFEVTVPATERGGAQLRMTLDAEHWMEAWRLALAELGESVPPPDQVTCRIGHDGSVEVVTLNGGRRLFIHCTTHRHPRDSPSGTPGVPAGIPAVERDPADRPRIRRISRPPETTAGPAAPALAVPSAAPLTGSASTSADEALAMLERHVRCESILLWLPNPGRQGYKLRSALSRDVRMVAGVILRDGDAITPHLTDGPGRRTFAGDGIGLRISRGFGRKFKASVKSVVWAPIVVRGQTVALTMLLNAGRPTGFTDPELSAVDELSRILGARLERAGLDGFE